MTDEQRAKEVVMTFLHDKTKKLFVKDHDEDGN